MIVAARADNSALAVTNFNDANIGEFPAGARLTLTDTVRSSNCIILRLLQYLIAAFSVVVRMS